MKLTAVIFCLVAFACAPKECQRMSALAVDEAAMCLGPAVPTIGLSVCWNPDEPQGKGIDSVCLVDGAGALFMGGIGSTVWLEGSGWTHSAYWSTRSTLSANDETRCSKALAPSFGPTCQ